jgi:hypothetical protein
VWMIVVAALVLAVFGGQAAANSVTFEFYMERRAVDGSKNLKRHALDAGELTLSGAVWVVNKDGGGLVHARNHRC